MQPQSRWAPTTFLFDSMQKLEPKDGNGCLLQGERLLHTLQPSRMGIYFTKNF